MTNPIIEKLRSDFLLFSKYISPATFYSPFAGVHRELESILRDVSITQANVILPRGLAKTTFVSVMYPLYHIFADNPEGKRRYIYIVSKTRDIAIGSLVQIKDILEYSDNFRAVFGYWGKQTAIKWSEDQIVLADGTKIVAKGTGQQIRGTNNRSVRPTLIILDDPEDENNTKTKEAMDANFIWLEKAALPTLSLDKSNFGKIIVVGTPIHQNCIVERLANDPTWRTMRRSYIYTKSDGTQASLWSSMLSLKKLLEMKEAAKASGRLSAFYSERMCEIIGDEEQLIQPDYIQYYTGEFFKDSAGYGYLKLKTVNGIDENRTIPVNVFMGVDPASSTKKSADYSTIVPIAVDAQLNRYVLKYMMKRVTPMTLADHIFDFYDVYSPQRTTIESVAFQEMLREYVKSKKYMYGLDTKESPRTSKSSRLESLEPVFAQKKVYVMEEGMDDLVNQLITFPRGKFDDLLDGFYYANKRIFPPAHGEIAEKPKVKERKRRFTIGSWITA